MNISVENKFCRLLRKSHSFALNNDIKFKRSNLVTENDRCGLGFRESPCDISFEIDTSRLKSKSRRSALENDSKNLLQFAKL